MRVRLGDDRVELVHPQRAVVVDRDVAEGRAGAGGQFLPRDQVGVVLHLGGDDLIARADAKRLGFLAAASEARVREGVGDQVEGLGRVCRPDDFVIGCPDEAGNPAAGILEALGCERGQRVRATVHRRVVQLVVLALGLQHPSRLLRRGAGVEVHQRMAVDALAEQREIAPDGEHLRRLRSVLLCSRCCSPARWWSSGLL